MNEECLDDAAVGGRVDIEELWQGEEEEEEGDSECTLMMGMQVM